MLLRAVSAALLPLLLLLLGVPGCRSGGTPVSGTGTPPVIYKWVDENGVSHYTSDRGRIPRSIRDRIPTRAEAPTPLPTPPPAPAPQPELAAEEVPRQEWDAGEPAASEPATPDAAASTPLPAAQSAPIASAAQTAPGGPAASDAWAAMDHTPEPPAAKGSLADDADDPGASEARARAIADLDARIAALEADIAADESTLKDLLSDASTPDLALGEDGELRTISERLPRLLAEVQSLRDQRGKLARP